MDLLMAVLPPGLVSAVVQVWERPAAVTPKTAAEVGVKGLLFLLASSIAQNLNLHAWCNARELQ